MWGRGAGRAAADWGGNGLGPRGRWPFGRSATIAAPIGSPRSRCRAIGLGWRAGLRAVTRVRRPVVRRPVVRRSGGQALSSPALVTDNARRSPRGHRIRDCSRDSLVHTGQPRSPPEPPVARSPRPADRPDVAFRFASQLPSRCFAQRNMVEECNGIGVLLWSIVAPVRRSTPARGEIADCRAADAWACCGPDARGSEGDRT